MRSLLLKKQRRREIYTTALKHQMVYGISSGKSNKFALAGEESSGHFPGWASSLKMRSTAGGLERLSRVLVQLMRARQPAPLRANPFHGVSRNPVGADGLREEQLRSAIRTEGGRRPRSRGRNRCMFASRIFLRFQVRCDCASSHPVIAL